MPRDVMEIQIIMQSLLPHYNRCPHIITIDLFYFCMHAFDLIYFWTWKGDTVFYQETTEHGRANIIHKLL